MSVRLVLSLEARAGFITKFAAQRGGTGGVNPHRAPPPLIYLKVVNITIIISHRQECLQESGVWSTSAADEADATLCYRLKLRKAEDSPLATLKSRACLARRAPSVTAYVHCLHSSWGKPPRAEGARRRTEGTRPGTEGARCWLVERSPIVFGGCIGGSCLVSFSVCACCVYADASWRVCSCACKS